MPATRESCVFMSGKSRWDYLKAIYFRYKKVSKPLRSRILDEYCQVCGYNCKYAIRLLGGPAPQKPKNRGQKPGSSRNRGHVYGFLILQPGVNARVRTK
jgi:hypothetical protein